MCESKYIIPQSTHERFLVFDQSYDLHRILVVVNVIGQRRQFGVVTLLGDGVMDQQEALEGREGQMDGWEAKKPGSLVKPEKHSASPWSN